jgi:hypothetical protein
MIPVIKAKESVINVSPEAEVCLLLSEQLDWINPQQI